MIIISHFPENLHCDTVDMWVHWCSMEIFRPWSTTFFSRTSLVIYICINSRSANTHHVIHCIVSVTSKVKWYRKYRIERVFCYDKIISPLITSLLINNTISRLWRGSIICQFNITRAIARTPNWYLWKIFEINAFDNIYLL